MTVEPPASSIDAMRISWVVGSLAVSACVGDVAATEDAGGKDATTVDAPRDVQQGVDAPSDTMDAPTTFCSNSTHAFCADFDNVADAGAGWTTVQELAGGHWTLVSATFVSSPYSAGSFVPVIADGGTVPADAIFARTLTVKSANPVVHVEWEMRHNLVVGGGSFAFFQVYLNAVSLVSLAVDGGGWYMTSRPGTMGGTRYPLSAPPPTTGWIHFTLDITFAKSATGAIKLQMSGADAGTTTLLDVSAIQTTSETTAQSVDIDPGVVAFITPSQQADVRYDNIVVDLN